MGYGIAKEAATGATEWVDFRGGKHELVHDELLAAFEKIRKGQSVAIRRHERELSRIVDLNAGQGAALRGEGLKMAGGRLLFLEKGSTSLGEGGGRYNLRQSDEEGAIGAELDTSVILLVVLNYE